MAKSQTLKKKLYDFFYEFEELNIAYHDPITKVTTNTTIEEKETWTFRQDNKLDSHATLFFSSLIWK